MNYSRIRIICLTFLGAGLMLGGKGSFAVFPSQVFAQNSEQRQLEADRLIEKGNKQVEESKFKEALESFQQALIINRNFNNREGESNSLVGLGSASYSLGQYQKAIEYHQQALAIAKQIGNRDGEASSLNGLGDAYYSLGQYQQAIDFQQQALAIFKQSSDRTGEADSLTGLGDIYSALEQYQKAIEYHQQALAIFKQASDRTGEVTTLNSLGNIYSSQEQYQKAIDYHQQALAIAKQVSDRTGEAISLTGLGDAYSALKHYQKAIEYYQQALAIFKQTGDLNSEAYARNNLGEAYHFLNQSQKANENYQQALAIFRQTGDREGEGIALNNLGELLAEQKQIGIAIVFYKQSVNIREGIRRDIRSLDRKMQQSYVKSVAETYRNLADLLLQQERTLEAQQVLDLLKVQELEDNLRDVRSSEQNQKKMEYQPLEQDIIKLGKELTELQRLNSENKLTPQQQQRLTQLVQQEEDGNKQFNAFIDSPAVQALVQQLSSSSKQQNLNLEDLNSLRQTLGNFNAVILYPIILSDRIELILTTSYAPPIRRTVKVTKEELTQAIIDFRGEIARQPVTVAETEDAKKAAQKLYNWLVKPFEAELQQSNTKTIIYSPDGVMRYVPLAALYDGKQWLAEKYSINNITASSIDKFIPRSQPAIRILAGAFGGQGADKRFGLGGLPASIVEVETIATNNSDTLKLIGEQFTLAATKANIGSYSVIHLATHAQFRTGRPDDSFVLFGNGDKATLSTIKNWSLGNVDLVVLSACETGIGGKLGSGEEILGLGYQFQRAGARATIATLWKVSDAGTQTLMNNFYANLKKGNLTKAEALRQSQIALISGQAVLDGKKLDHPYYWSPFILIGNGL